MNVVDANEMIQVLFLWELEKGMRYEMLLCKSSEWHSARNSGSGAIGDDVCDREICMDDSTVGCCIFASHIFSRMMKLLTLLSLLLPWLALEFTAMQTVSRK
jgi:hypothetical protein